MIRLGFLLFCLFWAVSISAQNKQDYVWIFGDDQNSEEEGVQNLLFDFNKRSFEPRANTNALEFDQNNVSICNNQGELLYYSNGCAIANREHKLLLNGDSINAGPFFDILWRGDCSFGYPGLQDILLLEDPNNNDGYYLITKPLEYEFNSGISPSPIFLNYSYIDGTLDNGLGGVTIKNDNIFKADFLAAYLTAIQHINGQDWWIIQPGRADNIFYTFLLDETGFKLMDNPSLGNVEFGDGSSASGRARFSPDGKLYAFYNVHDGLFLYDFDRETGEFDNFRTFDFIPFEGPKFSSIEFSSDSRFLYIAATDSLWQVDLLEEDLNEGKELIDVYDGVPDPFYNGFISCALAPDCKIYVRGSSSSYSMHVINNPNEKGKACNFVQRGLKLPLISSVDTYPNVPRYRVDDEEKCDPSITTMFGEAVFYRRKLELYPNPTRGPLRIDLPQDRSGVLYFFDMQGREIQSPMNVSKNQTIDMLVHHWPVGMYNIEFIPDNQSDRLFWTGLVRKM